MNTFNWSMKDKVWAHNYKSPLFSAHRARKHYMTCLGNQQSGCIKGIYGMSVLHNGQRQEFKWNGFFFSFETMILFINM